MLRFILVVDWRPFMAVGIFPRLPPTVLLNGKLDSHFAIALKESYCSLKIFYRYSESGSRSATYVVELTSDIYSWVRA